MQQSLGVARPPLQTAASRSATRGRPATARRRRQRDVLCDVMLSASQCDSWLTLDELAKLTHYPPASISAQLRHLRKPEFGAYELDKRTRASGKILRGEDFGTVWEYQLRHGLRPTAPARDSTACPDGDFATGVGVAAIGLK